MPIQECNNPFWSRILQCEVDHVHILLSLIDALKAPISWGVSYCVLLHVLCWRTADYWRPFVSSADSCFACHTEGARVAQHVEHALPHGSQVPLPSDTLLHLSWSKPSGKTNVPTVTKLLTESRHQTCRASDHAPSRTAPDSSMFILFSELSKQTV